MRIKGAGAHQSLYFWTSNSNREIGQPILQDNQTELASFQVYKFQVKQRQISCQVYLFL